MITKRIAQRIAEIEARISAAECKDPDFYAHIKQDVKWLVGLAEYYRRKLEASQNMVDKMFRRHCTYKKGGVNDTMTTEKLTQRNEATGAIEWTEYVDEVIKQDPMAVGELARRLIFEYEQEKGGAENA